MIIGIHLLLLIRDSICILGCLILSMWNIHSSRRGHIGHGVLLKTRLTIFISLDPYTTETTSLEM